MSSLKDWEREAAASQQRSNARRIHDKLVRPPAWMEAVIIVLLVLVFSYSLIYLGVVVAL